jgi:UDP-N-acetylmuramoylalanine-D-glutamate ligase
MPHAIAFVDHEELKEPAKLSELSAGELERLKAEIALPRQVSAMANLVATRRAALAYERRMQALPSEGSTAHRVSLAYRADGKPELRFADESGAKAFQGADVSLADSNGFSVAWIGPAPAGMDIEPVEKRDTETWLCVFQRKLRNRSTLRPRARGRCWKRAERQAV